MKNEIREITLGHLVPSATNPRKEFVEHELEKLTASVVERGVINPILVRPFGDQWEIVAGERRYRASQLAGKLTVPCIVREMSDREKLEIQLVENIDRHDLNPMEEAEGVSSLVDLGVSADDVAGTLHRSGDWVQSRLVLMDLPEVAKQCVRTRVLGIGAANQLAKLEPAERDEAVQVVMDLGEDATEAAVRDMIVSRYILPKQRQTKWAKRRVGTMMELDEKVYDVIEDCEGAPDYVRSWGAPYGKYVLSTERIGHEARLVGDEDCNWGALAAVHDIKVLVLPIGDVVTGELVYVVDREKVRHAEGARRDGGMECTLGKRAAAESPEDKGESDEEKGERKKDKESDAEDVSVGELLSQVHYFESDLDDLIADVEKKDKAAAALLESAKAMVVKSGEALESGKGDE